MRSAEKHPGTGARAGLPAARQRRHVRHPGASRPPAALRLPAGTRRRAGLLGGAQGHPAEHRAEPAGRADRGPPDGLRRFRRRSSRAASTAAAPSRIWDAGTYATEKWREDEVIVVLHGGKARGRYALIRTGGKNWLMHRMKDQSPAPKHYDNQGDESPGPPNARSRPTPPAPPKLAARPPNDLRPMLATAGSVDGHLGRRALAVRGQVGRHPRPRHRRAVRPDPAQPGSATTSPTPIPELAGAGGSAGRAHRGAGRRDRRARRQAGPASHELQQRMNLQRPGTSPG